MSAVNHPSHYNRGGIEAIEVIEVWDLNFNLGNALKYISRAGYKNDAVEDLQKAVWYIQREIAKHNAQVIRDPDERLHNGG